MYKKYAYSRLKYVFCEKSENVYSSFASENILQTSPQYKTFPLILLFLSARKSNKKNSSLLPLR